MSPKKLAWPSDGRKFDASKDVFDGEGENVSSPNLEPVDGAGILLSSFFVLDAE